MSFDLALRLIEILLGFAFTLQSLEHSASPRKFERALYVLRLIFSLALIGGLYAPWACLGLMIIGLSSLAHFNGPYNGGSDRMGLLILTCLTLALWLPEQKWQELALGYLALQLTLSYFISGWVKIVNPEWRNGQALEDVFRFSAYPVSQSLRGWSDHKPLLKAMSWAVIAFELAFPFTLLTQTSLIIALLIAATFHLANACLFGLNRFFWVWIAAYPAILWLQERLF